MRPEPPPLKAEGPSGQVIARICLIAMSTAILVMACLSRFSIRSVWDDAYIALRYADNFLETQRLSWNPGGAPTYGLTSPLYLSVVTPLRMLIGGSPALVACVASLLCGLVALSLLIRLVWTLIPEVSGRRSLAACVVLFSVAYSAGDVATHFVSGMDTMFAIAYLTVYLLLLEGRQARARVGAALFAGFWGGLALVARPDLLLFTLTIPAIVGVLATEKARRVFGWRVLGTALLTVGAGLALNAWYFDSALPLPFHAKGTRLYGDSIFNTYAGIAPAQLRAFMKSYWFLFLPTGAAFIVNPRRWWRETEAAEKGIAAGTLAFLAYHALFVLPIMYYSQRFYYPALPALFYLGLCASLRWLDLSGSTPLRAKAGFASAMALAAIGIAGLGQSGIREGKALADPQTGQAFGRFSLSEHYASAQLTRVWPGLDRLSRLPDDLVIAATEVGLPAAMNPGKKIIDLSGLNDTEIALGHTTAAATLEAALPDLIYLPHPDYREMNQEIRAAPRLWSRYEVIGEGAARPGLSVAILRESPYRDALRDGVAAEEAQMGPSPAR